MADNTELRPRGTRKQLLIVTWLTCIRAPLILLFMVGAIIDILWPIGEENLNGHLVLQWCCVALMGLSAFTDLFDGLYARKWNVTSKFGAMCDPLMDKVFFIVVFPTLTAMFFLKDEVQLGVLSLIFTVLHILRDLWVVTLRALAVGKADMKANFVGKLRTAISFPIGVAIYCHLVWEWFPKALVFGLLLFGFLLNLYSTVVYTKRYGFAIQEAMDSEK